MKTLLRRLWASHYEKALVLIDQAIVSGSNFLIGILISKAFGLHDLGVYAFAWMALMMCSSIQNSLINVPMANEYAKRDKPSQRKYVQQLFIIQLLLSLVLALLCFGGIVLLQKIPFFQTLRELSLVLPLLIFLYTLYDFLRRVYFIRGNLFKAFILDTLINLSQVAYLVSILFYHQSSLETTLFFFALTYLAGFILGVAEFMKPIHFQLKTLRILKQQWAVSSWLFSSALLQWFAGNVFIISAGSILGTEAAGVIRIAQSIVGVLNVFFIALELYVPLKAARIYSEGGYTKLLRYICRLLMVGGAVCLVFVGASYLASSSVLTWVYGINYAKYGDVVSLFALFYVIVFTGYPLRFALRAVNNTRAMFIAYLLATAFSFLFSDKLILTWGIGGVLAGLASTQLIMQAWYIRELYIFPSKAAL